MKKIILSSLLLLPLSLYGCSNGSDAQAVKNLNAQLDEVESVVTLNDNSLGESGNYYNENSSEKFNYLRDRAYNSQMEEQYLKGQILTLSSYLKANQNKKYKLSRADSQALRTLTQDIERNITYLSKTDRDIKSSIRKINKINQKSSQTLDNSASSEYQALNSLMNARKAYLNNLFSTMNEVSQILSENNVVTTPNYSYNNDNLTNNYTNNYSNFDNSNFNNSSYNNANNNIINGNQAYNEENLQNTENDNQSNANNQINSNEKKGITKNIDTYQNQNMTNNVQNDNLTLPNNSQTYNNYNYPYNAPYNNYNYRNGYNYNNYNKYPYNSYGYNYGGYNTPYNNNYRYYQNNPYGFNPNRNTDTYYPLNRNIDTYRFNPKQVRNTPIASATATTQDDLPEKQDNQLIGKIKHIFKNRGQKEGQNIEQNHNIKQDDKTLLEKTKKNEQIINSILSQEDDVASEDTQKKPIQILSTTESENSDVNDTNPNINDQ